MADIPVGIPWGVVVGNLGGIISDTSDEGRVPNVEELTGTATLRPVTADETGTTTFPLEWIQFPEHGIYRLRTLVCPIIAGKLYPPDTTAGTLPAEHGVPVIATFQPAGIPTVVQWEVTFNLDGTDTQPYSRLISVPADGVVDLAGQLGESPQPGVVAVTTTEATTRAVAAADRAETAAGSADLSASAAAGSASSAADTLAQMQKGQPGGVAELDAAGLLPETRVPERLTTDALSATIGGQVEAATVDLAPSRAGVAATQPLLRKMTRAVQDASLLIIGDSTGNETPEWAYQASLLIAADWPTHTVLYQLWNDTTKAYDAAVTIQTGTGARTLTIWNCSVPGWTAYGPLGERFAAAVVAPRPDLVLISLGHNEDVGAFPGAMRGRYLALTESVAAAHPGADVALILQNPATTNDNQALRADLLTQIAAERGFGIIDVHQHFIDAGKPAEWYADGLHPSVQGSLEWANVVHAHFEQRPDAQPLTRQSPTLLTVGQNLLRNADFALFDGPAPDDWVNTGATLSKDTTNFETGAYGLRMQSAGAAAAYVQQNIPVPLRNAIRGSWITVAARVKLPATATGTQYRIGLAISGGTSVTTISQPFGLNGWRWMCASGFVPDAVTNVGVTLYADSGTTGTADWTVDRVCLVRGDMPRDMRLV